MPNYSIKKKIEFVRDFSKFVGIEVRTEKLTVRKRKNPSEHHGTVKIKTVSSKK